MSRPCAERDSRAERVRILLSVYLRTCREGGEVPGDACACADMAIEKGHGVRYFYDKGYFWISLGLMRGSICVPLYLVALNFASFLSVFRGGAGGPATSGRQIMAKYISTFLIPHPLLKKLKTVRSRQTQ